MKKFTKYLVAGAFAACSAYASADPITVGGVTWDPDLPVDFRADFNFVQDFAGNPNVAGTELFGYGIIYSLNNSLFRGVEFCSGCELTFEIGGFLTDDSNGFQDGEGYINVYRDYSLDYDYATDPYNATAATNGDLWIRFNAGNVNFLSTESDTSNPYLSGQLSVQWFLDQTVLGTSALAFDSFETGTQVDGGDAYSSANATFGIDTGATGNGTLFADTVPAPTTLALFGLSVLGLGAVKRRRKA